MSISERLKLVCQEKNWKLKDFSEGTGLPYRTAQGYLNGTREPNAEGMAVICKKLNVNLNWLLTGTGNCFIIDNPHSYDIQLILDRVKQLNEEGRKNIEVILDCFLNKKNFVGE